jgi:hypothetical protein
METPIIPSIPSIPIITTKYKIIHGLRVLEHKLKIQQSLYYNNYDSFLENLIVLEYMTELTAKPTSEQTAEPIAKPIAKPTSEPTSEPIAKPTSKTINGPIANVLGCWNSECIGHKYLSHKKSFNQPILRDLMNTNNPNFTILLGDNIYERPDDILIKNHFGETEPDKAKPDKAKPKTKTKAKDKTKVKNPPYNYMSLWLNGFACFNNIRHPFFAILGNHDLHPDVMRHQISQTYINNPTIEPDGANLILTLNSKWIMPEEFYVLIINGWHLLMLNSNSLYLNDSEQPSNIQEHLITAYLDKLDQYDKLAKSDKLASSTTYSKKVIVCLHEPIYAIGHKPKKQIIDNTKYYISKLIDRYKDLIKYVFTADEHNTQKIHNELQNIDYVVAAGAPYSGGDNYYKIDKITQNPNFVVGPIFNSDVLVQADFNTMEIKFVEKINDLSRDQQNINDALFAIDLMNFHYDTYCKDKDTKPDCIDLLVNDQLDDLIKELFNILNSPKTPSSETAQPILTQPDLSQPNTPNTPKTDEDKKEFLKKFHTQLKGLDNLYKQYYIKHDGINGTRDTIGDNTFMTTFEDLKQSLNDFISPA